MRAIQHSASQFGGGLSYYRRTVGELLTGPGIWVALLGLGFWALFAETDAFVIGIVTGSVLALGAVGLTLIYGVLKFAHFAPDRPKLSPEAYTALVQQVTARSPWEESLPVERRVVIPGYRNLHEFSRDEESAVKAGLGSRFWTLVHWTNWRVTFPVAENHQEAVAAKVLADLQAGHLVQLLITNFPILEVNHGVVAYGYRVREGTIDLAVYDPNQPDRPGVVSFRSAQRHFWSTQLFNTIPGPIRAFRMHYSPLL